MTRPRRLDPRRARGVRRDPPDVPQGHRSRRRASSTRSRASPPDVVGFAEEVVAAGFTVVMPHLFGTPGADVNPRSVGSALRQVCVSNEFTKLATGVTAPVADLAAQPGPRAPRRARRTGRRRARHVLHRRFRAGHDGRRRGGGAGRGPALRAVRDRQGPRGGPQPEPCGPGHGQAPGGRRLLRARCALPQGPGDGHPLRDPDPRARRQRSSASSSKAVATRLSRPTGSSGRSIACWPSSTNG